MIVKTSHKKSINPQKNDELNAMVIEGDSTESPIAITFISKEEAFQFISTLSQAIINGHDTVHFYPNGLKYDKNKFASDVPNKSSVIPIKHLNPKQINPKPMEDK